MIHRHRNHYLTIILKLSAMRMKKYLCLYYTGHMKTKATGFTMPELMITMVVISILVTTVIAALLGWLNQFTLSSTRQTMTIDMQAALSRITDDVRQSRGVLTENIEADANAPTATGKWRTDASQLVFGKTPYQANGTALYDVPALFSGKPDSIVYYVQNNTLYRRTIPANYAGNVTLPLLTCSSPASGGCAAADQRILGNITNAQFTYFDASNNPVVDPASIKSVEVNLTTARTQSGHTVTVKDKVRIAPPSLATIVPPTTGGGGQEPPVTQSTAGLITGPGGLQSTFSNITGRDAYVRGRLMLSNMSTFNLDTYRLDVANVGCGTRTTFPVTCTGQQPIAVAFYSAAKATPVCATSAQTSAYGITGLQSGCTPPNSTTPPFNKAAFTSTKSPGPTSVTCSFFSPATLAADTMIGGDVTANFCQKLTVNGDVYIKGNLNLALSTLQVAEGVTVRPVIVVNRQVTLNYSNIKANSAGVRPYIISFYSVNTTCSDSNTCTTLTNPEIYDSITTSPAAINITNYSNVNASLYSYFGTLNIDTSNVTGALAGQEIIVGVLSGVQLQQGIWPT